MTLGVVIVGAGGIAVAHVDAVLAEAQKPDPALRLTGLVSRSGGRVAAFADLAAERQGTHPWIAASVEDALTRHGTDLVVVCTESGDHARTALAAIEAGRHLLIEKPLATRLADVGRIADAARMASVRHPDQVIAVVSQRRFTPATAELVDAVAAGRLGRITSASVLMPWWRDREYYASRPWRGTWAGDGGGSLMNQGIHFADLLIALLGHPEQVVGFTGRVGHDVVETEDTAGAVIRFAGGAIATALTSTAASPGSPWELRVHGTGGSAMLGEIDDAERSATPAGASTALAQQYADVVDAVRSQRAPRVGLPEARAALALVKSVYIAEATAATVSFDAVLAGALDHLDRAGV